MQTDIENKGMKPRTVTTKVPEVAVTGSAPAAVYSFQFFDDPAGGAAIYIDAETYEAATAKYNETHKGLTPSNNT